MAGQKPFVYFDVPISIANHLAQATFRGLDRCPPKAKVTRRVRHFTILRDIAPCRSRMPQQPTEGVMPYCDGRLPAKAYKQQHRSQAARSIL
jgi:hypothetical protein